MDLARIAARVAADPPVMGWREELRSSLLAEWGLDLGEDEFDDAVRPAFTTGTNTVDFSGQEVKFSYQNGLLKVEHDGDHPLQVAVDLGDYEDGDEDVNVMPDPGDEPE